MGDEIWALRIDNFHDIDGVRDIVVGEVDNDVYLPDKRAHSNVEVAHTLARAREWSTAANQPKAIFS